MLGNTMTMSFRLVGLIFASATLWWSSSSLALGLGDLNVESTLAAPFKAKIPLTGMSRIDLEPSQFFIRLDSESKVKLQYRLERSGKTANIIIYSLKAIKNPLFDLRIQVEWDKGKVTRKYDVLIDPPSYSLQAPVKQITSAVSDEASKKITPLIAAAPSTKLPISKTSTTSPVVEASSVKIKSNIKEIPDSDPISHESYGPTVSGNSLWRIAKKVRSENEALTIYQWMHGIWKNNPQSFIKLNMHQLKIDQLLSIPLGREVEKTTHRAAYKIYVEHLALIQPPLQTTKIAKADESVPEVEIEPVIPENPASEVAIASVDVVQNLADEKSVVEKAPVVAAQDLPVASTELPAISEVVSSDKGDTLVTVTAPAEALVEEEVISELLEAPGTGGINEEAPIVHNITNEDDPHGSALKPRGDFVDQLPIIGADGQLDFIGRAIRQLDSFISSSSSWVSLALGSLVALLIVLLSRMFRSRPGSDSNLKLKVKEPALGVSPRRESTKATVKTDEDTVKIERPQQPSIQALAGADKFLDSITDEGKSNESEMTDTIGSDLPVASETEESVESSIQGSAGIDDFMDSLVDDDESSEVNKPEGSGKECFTASEAILEAVMLAAYGDTEKAIALLQTTLEIQPNIHELKIQLLKMHFKKHNAEAFETLISEIRPTITELDTDEVARLQVMYSTLCPDSLPLIARDNIIDPNRVVRALELDSDSTEDGESVDAFVETELEELAEINSESSMEIKDLAEDEIATPEKIENNDIETLDALDLFELDDDDAVEEVILGEIGIESQENQSLKSTSDDLDDMDDDDNFAEIQVMEASDKVSEQAMSSEGSLDDGAILPDPNNAETKDKSTFQLDIADEETLEFVSVEEFESKIGEDEEILTEDLIDEPESNAYSLPVQGRIIHFPDSSNKDAKSSEFEAELMMTLQTMRDQMQQMNERLFRQERENHHLRKTIDELSDNHSKEKQPKKA